MQNLVERSGVRCASERVYGSLDIVKFLMALAVICIHTAPFLGTPLATGMRNVADIAVPFFFMASGFLCFNKCNCGDIRMNHASASASRVKKTIRGLAVLYVIWSALYLPLTIYGIQLDLVEGFSPVREILLLAFNYSLVGNQYLSWQLWYLLGSAFAFSGVYLLISMGFRWRGVLLTSGSLALAGFVVQLIVGYGLTEDMGLTGRVLFHYQFLFARNGFCPGLFYVALGGAVAQSPRLQTPVSLRIGLVVSILLIFFISGPLFNPTEAWNVGQICSPPHRHGILLRVSPVRTSTRRQAAYLLALCERSCLSDPHVVRLLSLHCHLRYCPESDSGACPIGLAAASFSVCDRRDFPAFCCGLAYKG